MGQNIFFQWLEFQFFDAPKEILKAWRNFLRFNLNYFSIKVLFKTLFSYWHKYRWQAPRGFYPWQWVEAQVGNLISRVLGAIVRTGLIIFGLISEVFVFCAGLLVLLVWLVLPFAIIFGIIYGINLAL